MTLQDKIDAIQALNEAELRKKLLIPLFTKMGFIDPILHHHSNEKGKDIVLKEFDNKFKKTEYLSVVVKAGDVTGSAHGNSGYFALINQIKQSLNEPYKHIYELKEVNIDKVIVVISGKFLPTSLESIYGTLKDEKLDKAIREPIDINKLPGLIDDFFPEYWNESIDEKKSLINQRNNLLNNLSKLSKVLFPDYEAQETFLQKLSNTEYDIDLLPYESATKFIANIGYKKLEIDEIDEFYSDQSISNFYSDIKKYFFETKKNTLKLLYDIDEVVELLKNILSEKNPEKMIDMTEDLRSHIGHRGLSFTTYDIEAQDEFFHGLQEYRTKKELLIEKNLLNFYNELYKTLKNKTEDELGTFFLLYSKNEKDRWIGYEMEINFETNELIKLEFFEKQEDLVTETNSRSKQIKKYSKSGNNYIKVEVAINNFRFSEEEGLNLESFSKKYTWPFTKGFERMFLEHIGYLEL